MIGRTIGQYQVIDKIGEGGMGAVYKAEDTTLHRLVALKTLAHSLSEDPEAKERFVREAQAASALNHPNITTVFELVQDEEDDSQLICMEYIEGKTIRDMVETGRVSVRKAIDIIMQAAEALEAAHNKGILHRDVKSANIMVSMEGRVKVMDFGLAHLETRSQLTRTGTTMGTLSYSSPEQISGRPVDARSEIFSLGVVFYELLTGKLPFDATNEAELVFSIINNEPERLTQVRDDVPDLVESVAKKMTEKDPELRYQSCGEVINDLKGIRKEMETSTVSFGLPPVGRMARLTNLAKLGIAVSTIALVALVALLVGTQSGNRESQPQFLVLLPCENFGTETNARLTDGLTVMLEARLGEIHGIGIISGESARQAEQNYRDDREIGEELGAEFVLRTSVLWTGVGEEAGNAQVVSRLISSTTGSQLWTETFNASAQELWDVRNEIANGISTLLGVDVDPIPDYTSMGNVSQDAMEAYLWGQTAFTRRAEPSSWETAVEQFSLAVQLAPDFMEARAMLSRAHSWGVWYNEAPEMGEDALREAEAAWNLAPNSVEALLARGYYTYWVTLDYPAALESFEAALRIRPSDAQALMGAAFVQRRLGQWPEAIEKLRSAVQLAPLDPSALGNLGEFLYVMHDYDGAVHWCQQALTVQPNRRRAKTTLAKSYLGLGDQDKALDILTAWASIEDQTPVSFTLGTYPEMRVLVRVFPGFADSIARRETDSPLFEAIGFGQWNRHLVAIDASRAKGEIERVQEHLDAILQEWDDPYRFIDPLDQASALLDNAIVQAWMGNGSEAADLLPEIEGLMEPFARGNIIRLRIDVGLAELAVLIGDNSKALDLLEQIVEPPSMINMKMVELDPVWNPLRSDPRYQALLSNQK